MNAACAAANCDYLQPCPIHDHEGTQRTYRTGYLSGYTVDENGCWIWSNLDQGYGRITRNGVRMGAHRYFYIEAYGPIPDGMTVDHLCFVPACVNPQHLRLLTKPENDRNQRSSFATHCSQGHEWTEENTMRRPIPGKPEARPRRLCRTCKQDRERRVRAERRTA